MMTEHDDPIPRDYDGWRYCIEHWCGIPLTADFVSQRIAALEDRGNEHTRRFVECYGQAHHAQVLGWFRRWIQTDNPS
jgi:hypothetical protein